ncbi:hypothetical protein RCL_jg22774.t1 [Rhizophagus clarus]|uniref:Uncharacterized protein n=1 Tax=Rhizophagus clarus TaxID=94130 RepID=A0A8H3QKI9_9GLOM|nr:hypothetical protein RCL_jg22774.t1 [Rhizophagus clarus]
MYKSICFGVQTWYDNNNGLNKKFKINEFTYYHYVFCKKKPYTLLIAKRGTLYKQQVGIFGIRSTYLNSGRIFIMPVIRLRIIYSQKMKPFIDAFESANEKLLRQIVKSKTKMNY